MFRDVCAPKLQADGRYRSTISPVWTIGPKVHGGTLLAASAAAGLQALRDGGVDRPDGQRLSRMDLLPVAAATDFRGAPNPGEVTFEVVVRKTGKQICLADVELSQHDRVLARTSLTFGHVDEEVAYQSLPTDPRTDSALGMPAEPPAEALYYDARSGAMGEQLGNIVHLAEGCDIRLDHTAPVMRGETGEPAFRLWVKPFAGDADDPDMVALFAMMTADISPPVPMNLGHVGWAPTIQLTTYLRRRPAPGWLRVLSSSRSVGSRLFDEDHLVVDSTGALVAQSRQLALIPRG